MLSSYEARLILEKMEKEIRFLKALLGDASVPVEGWVAVTPETYLREADRARRFEHRY